MLVQTLALQDIVSVVDKSSLFDLESLSIYALLIGSALVFFYFKSSTTPVVSKPKKNSIVSPKESEKTSEPDLDWIPQHLKKNQPQKRQ